MNLSPQDVQNALAFLNRVDLKGSEALPMAELLMKLQTMAQEMAQKKEPAPVLDEEPLPKDS
jgi:hypothetical protein